ncbi:MAG: flagellin, partial [Planctomycetota bacterium]
MGMVVNHNISAINTLRNLDYSNRAMSKSLQKLSSGYRINSGQDGPADLIISEQLRAQTVGLQRAVRNTQEATNVLGIAEGALNEMNAILKTMRQLALHAANNGITSPDQVAADQAEVDSSIQTI